MVNRASSISTYRVTVGHTTVVVQASSPEGAIALARRQLAQELPRFYDVIRSMASDRFTVLKAA